MFAMMVAYSSPKVPIPNPPIAVSPELEVVERGVVPRLVASNPPAVSVIESSAGALERAPGAELEFDDFYLAYWKHCKAFDGRVVSPSEAVEQTNKLCHESAIPIQRRGKKRFLVGVRIKTATGSRARLGPMARKMTSLTMRGCVAWCCVQREERNMIEQRSKLITELENLQKSRRDAVAAYKRTGDRNYWREACEVSQTITAKLHEFEETGLDGLDKAIDGLMAADQ